MERVSKRVKSEVNLMASKQAAYTILICFFAASQKGTGPLTPREVLHYR